jgi:hypothetical protein
MILRSFPITDFSPLDGGVRDRCPPLGPLVRDSVLGSTEELRFPITDFSPLDGGVRDRCPPLGPLVRDSVLGSTEELRVNMKAPDKIKVTMVTPGQE